MEASQRAAAFGPPDRVPSTSLRAGSDPVPLVHQFRPLFPKARVHRRLVYAKQPTMAATTNPRLLGIGGPLKGTAFPLPAGEVSIGRDSSNQLWVSDPALSRRHCLVIADNGQFSIRELGSRNGTLVNGVPE